jgi:hypothetical protein
MSKGILVLKGRRIRVARLGYDVLDVRAGPFFVQQGTRPGSHPPPRTLSPQSAKRKGSVADTGTSISGIGAVDLRRLRYFVLVAEELSFSRAARRTSLSQQALSSQIRSLEDEVGRILFFRTTRRVELTPAGRALLPKARASLATAAEALASARAAGPDPRYSPLA